MTEEYTPEYVENILRNEFKNDSLYRKIIKTPLEDDLFHDKILTLLTHPDHLYSTEEASKFILEKKDGEDRVGVPPGSLRHYINNLESYVSPAAVGGRSKRLNYESIFRLQMIYLLKDQYGVTGLQQLVGILGSTVDAADERPLVAQDNQSIKKLLHLFTESGFLIPDEKEGVKVNPMLSNLLTRVQNLEDSQQLLLSLPEESEERRRDMEEKISELEDQLRQQEQLTKIQERKLKFDITSLKMKIENQLYKEGLQEWGKLPDTERMKRVGIFAKAEDTTKKDMFIRNYMNEHLEDRLRKEMGIDEKEE